MGLPIQNKNGELMYTITGMKTGITLIVVVIVLITGFVLFKAGKPYQTAVFTIHKLVALAGLVGLILVARAIHPSAPLPWMIPVMAMLLGLGFILTFVSGGLISAMTKVSLPIRILHPIGAGLLVICLPILLVFLEKAGLLKTSF
jgi:hypothetical protein